MTKLFTAMAVAGIAMLLALPAPATAKLRADGASNIEHTEYSAQRRHWRGHRHWRGVRHWRGARHWRGHRHWAGRRAYWRHRHVGWRGRYWARPYAWGPRYRYWRPRYGYYLPYYRPWRRAYYQPWRSSYYGSSCPCWSPGLSVGFWGGPRFGFWF